MNSTQETRYNITTFDGIGFNLWKDKVTNAIRAIECEEVISSGFKINEGDENVRKEKVNKDERTKLILMSSISDAVLEKY